MSSADIQSKVKKLLAKAVVKTGSTSADKVYLVIKSGGNSDPINPTPPTETDVELVNAIFTNYDINLLGANIQAGDRSLTTDNTQPIEVGATIKQGSVKYIAITVNTIAPTSNVLLYKTQLRVK